MKYEQLVVYQGFDYKPKDKKALIALFKEKRMRCPKIIGVVETLPCKDCSGKIIEGTGGRKDLFLLINNKDINKFQIWRFTMHMKWREELTSEEEALYPKDFLNKYPRRW